MNKYDYETTQEMMRICNTFQLDRITTFFGEYQDIDQNISPLLIDNIESQLEMIYRVRKMLNEFLEGKHKDFKRAKVSPQRKASNYFIESLRTVSVTPMKRIIGGTLCDDQDFSRLFQSLIIIKNCMWKWAFLLSVIYEVDLGIENPFESS